MLSVVMDLLSLHVTFLPKTRIHSLTEYLIHHQGIAYNIASDQRANLTQQEKFGGGPVLFKFTDLNMFPSVLK